MFVRRLSGAGQVLSRFWSGFSQVLVQLGNYETGFSMLKY